MNREAAIDGRATGVDKGEEGRMARLELPTADTKDQRVESAPGDAHDAYGTAPARRGDGDDRVMLPRQRIHRRILAPVRRRGARRLLVENAEPLVDEVLLRDRQDVVRQPVQP